MTAASPTAPAEPAPTTTFDCPRCAAEVTERFWGPCSACRDELTRAASSSAAPPGGPPGFEPARFEPAMHVTPNHVATKD